MLIQITTENDDTLPTPIVFGTGDQIQMDEGASISVQGDGITGSPGANGATMTFLGSVTVDGTAILAQSGGHKITIGSTGSLLGMADGILLDAGASPLGGNIVQNDGSVDTLGTAIKAASSNNQITNSGTISGNVGIHVGKADSSSNLVTSSNNIVVNSGTISTSASAVVLWGDGSFLWNSGALTGGLPVQLRGTSSGRIIVENSNTIISQNDNAITGADEADWIINTGTIQGSIVLNGGKDLYEGRNGTVINGSVYLGDGDDIAYGGGAGEIFFGGEGNDTLEGGAGPDWLFGEGGNDTAVFLAADGANVDLNITTSQMTGLGLDRLVGIENLLGGSGADHFTGDDNTANALTGDGGNDTLDGGLGNDTLNGGAGIDTALFNRAMGATVNLAITAAQATGYGMDVLIGIENLIGGSGADHFTGNANANVLEGGDGDDTLIGGAGSDTAVFSGALGATVDLNVTSAQNTGYGMDVLGGIENLVGGTGSDHFIGDGNANVLDGGQGDDTLDGGAGNDTAVFSGSAGAQVDLTKTDAQATNYGADILLSIENLLGGSGADHFTGDDNTGNALTGGEGDDTLDGGLGNDTLNGGSGIDTALFSGTMGATVNLAITAAQATGYGMDVLLGIDNLVGGSGADHFTGDANANVLEGGDGDDTLIAGAGNDTAVFSGSTGATVNLAITGAQNTGYGMDILVGFETLVGGTGSDHFIGDASANAFMGGDGDDTLNGGLGIDTAIFRGAVGANVDLTKTGPQATNYGADTLLGIENLTGGTADDNFIGDGNANVLEGGEGNDTLNGGAGSDTAVFSGSVGAIVDLTKADAQDTRYGTDVLTGIENLVGGSGDDIFTGDQEDNALTGGDGNDILTGGNGSDTAVFTGKIAAQVDLTLSGAPQKTGYGLDTLFSIENLAGGEAGDTFTGDSNANVLTGNEGDDTLDGGLGNDVLEGGDGIDTVLFNKAIAAIVNLALTGQQNTGYGLDTLAGIENLAGGTGADRFTGDGNANKLSGNLGDDTLDGGLGDDELDGGAGVDTVAFSGLTGASVDLASGQAIGYGVDTLLGIENVIGSEGSDNLTGSSGANWLQGGSGGDLLNGGLGNDTLDGGSGLDVLRFTGSTGATVNLALTSAQNTGYGGDTILGFEALWGGTGADRFTGNSGNNAFIGEAGRDTISGASGHDTLAGGLGSDRLAGGSGKDLFVFDTKLSKTSNVDTITDFKRVDDTFQLENAIFKKLAKVGALSKLSFVVGAKAKDKNDYIVYDKAKGALYYDADGSGKGAAVKFAQIKKGLVIDHKDFFII